MVEVSLVDLKKNIPSQLQRMELIVGERMGNFLFLTVREVDVFLLGGLNESERIR